MLNTTGLTLFSEVQVNTLIEMYQNIPLVHFVPNDLCIQILSVSIDLMNGQEDFQNKLRDSFNLLKARNGCYSLRAFARKLDIQPATVSEILRGKRNVTATYAEAILGKLGSDSKVKAQIIAKIRATGKLGKAPLTSYQEITSTNYALMTEWWHFAILSLVRTKGFKSNSQFVAKRLGIPVGKAKNAVTKLITLGMLQVDENGNWVRTSKNLTTTDGISNDTIRFGHLQNLELAETSLMNDPVEERDFYAITFTSCPEKIVKARREIRNFSNTLVRELEDRDGVGSEVYKISVQLYPITRGRKRHETITN